MAMSLERIIDGTAVIDIDGELFHCKFNCNPPEQRETDQFPRLGEWSVELVNKQFPRIHFVEVNQQYPVTIYRYAGIERQKLTGKAILWHYNLRSVQDKFQSNRGVVVQDVLLRGIGALELQEKSK